MDYNKIIVRLGKTTAHLETYDLEFEFEDNLFKEKWIERYKAAQSYELTDREAFYNVNNAWTDRRIVDEVNANIDSCNRECLGMFDRRLVDITNQNDLNYIHHIMSQHHGKLDEWLTNPLFKNADPNLRIWLSNINQLVHRVEHRNSGNKRICVTWYDLPKTKTYDDSDYKYFVDTVEFGGLYLLYADIGKDLWSLTRDDDQTFDDFVPFTHYSSDFVVKFFDVNGQQALEKREQYQNYFLKYEMQFNSLGWHRDDVHLKPGAAKVAQLQYGTREELLNDIFEYDYVQSVYLI